jgi:hypothetical protein
MLGMWTRRSCEPYNSASATSLIDICLQKMTIKRITHNQVIKICSFGTYVTTAWNTAVVSSQTRDIRTRRA